MCVRSSLVLPFLGSVLVAMSAVPTSQEPSTRTSGPAESRSDIPLSFDPLPRHDLVVGPMTDADLDRLVAILGGMLARHDQPARRAFDVDFYYRNFVERLQAHRLSSSQQARVLAQFDAWAAEYATDTAAIARERRTLTALAVGKVAPEIDGKDLEGRAFRLSDYRGKVVVVAFTGEWCAACRGEYPFFRLLEEIYKNRPFALLGVSSDADETIARQGKASRGLSYRTWFDGRNGGPIADAWGVAAWPSTYVLDRQGVVRFVGLRQEDLLKGVRQLVEER